MEWLQLVFGGGIFIGFGALLTFIATRKKDTSTDLQSRFADNIGLNEYLDTKVTAALAPALAQIKALEEDMKILTARERATKEIVRRFFQRLIFWNEQGRTGVMPMPTREDMGVLDISDLVPHPTIEGETP